MSVEFCQPTPALWMGSQSQTTPPPVRLPEPGLKVKATSHHTKILGRGGGKFLTRWHLRCAVQFLSPTFFCCVFFSVVKIYHHNFVADEQSGNAPCVGRIIRVDMSLITWCHSIWSFFIWIADANQSVWQLLGKENSQCDLETGWVFEKENVWLGAACTFPPQPSKGCFEATCISAKDAKKEGISG